MSSYSKGKEFELRTKAILEEILDKSELELKLQNESEMWVVPRDSRIYHPKSYQYTFGPSTKTDVSIEDSSDIGSSHYLIIIECKCYTHSVGIDEIQEFTTRLHDLNATKGIFVTTNSFQSGAIACAKAHNIALVRINDKNETSWYLHRIQYNGGYTYNEVNDSFLQSDFSFSSIVVDGFNFSISLVDYLLDLFCIDEGKLKTVIPYYCDDEIKMKAQAFLGNLPYVRVSNKVLKFYAIKENILVDDEKDCCGFMGKCDFINRKISIDGSLYEQDENRYRFTFAHELGHAYLHQPLLKHLVADAHDNNVFDLKNCSKWEKRLEIQANHFAAFLLMPQIPLINIYMEVKNKLNYHPHALLRMDDNPTSIHDCKIMFYVLSRYFGVSKQVAMIRLRDENLLDEVANNPFSVF